MSAMGSHQSNQRGRKSSEVWSGRVAALGILCLLICGLSFIFDVAVIDWVKNHDSKPLKEFAGFLSRWGDWPELMLYGVIGLGISWIARRRELFKLVVCMMIAATISGAVVNAVRLVTGRARPNNTEAVREWNGLWNGNEFLLFKSKYHSFPSGHTGAAFAFFSIPLFANRRDWWPLVVAAGIGWSRIYLNVHHLSDVVVGAFVGLITAAFVWRRFQRRQKAEGRIKKEEGRNVAK
jgi:membrane-associated phospholipid phosphatase